MSGRTLVVIPTYNEAQTVEPIVARVRRAEPDVEILIVDDASPDGTGQIADRIAAEDSAVHVLHRPGKVGLGAAYVAGFTWALDRGFAAVIEMDADGSHQPEELHLLLGALGSADLVLGSRYVPGGRVENWPRHRKLLSAGGNHFTRAVLGVPVRDATGGYRAFRSTALKDLDLESVHSQGYCFQVDLVRRALGAGLRVVEVPITFVERVEGTSKMTGGIVAEALWRVTGWGFARRLDQVRSWRRGGGRR
jgi:dolichol-phosphate mannosyltransferase